MPDIACIGIATVDLIGQPIDSWPHTGQLQVFDHLTMATGGCSVNCAFALAKMGLSASLFVKTGADSLGDFVISEAKRLGISTDGIVRDPSTHTAFTMVCVNSSGERTFLHTFGANATLTADDIRLDLLEGHKIAYIGGAMLMPTFDGEQTAGLLKKIREMGITTVLDTAHNDRVKDWYAVIAPCLPHLNFFIPSDKEATQFAGGIEDPAELARFFRDNGAKNVVIKMGDKGSYLLAEDGQTAFAPVYPVENVVDTTGAGDTWGAGFLAGLNLNMDLPEAMKLGNATAAHCIQAAGAATGIKSLADIQRFQQQAPRG